MSDLTDVDAFTSPVRAPADGDTRNAASVTQGFQPSADRTRFLLNCLAGHMLWDGGAYTDTPGGGGLGVFVSPPRNLVIGDARLTPTIADREVPTASLTANAWGYVYAFNSSGFALQASLDAPDAARVWKSTGIATHRYLCTIKRDGSTGLYAFERRNGQTRWRNAAASRVVLSSGSALSGTAVSCAGWAPPHARMVTLLARVHDAASGGGTASLSRNGDAAVPVVITCPPGADASCEVTVPCDSLQRVAYLVSVADLQLTLTVLGWPE